MPIPLPKWFWTWVCWYLGGRAGLRPNDAPATIPKWVWTLLEARLTDPDFIRSHPIVAKSTSA